MEVFHDGPMDIYIHRDLISNRVTIMYIPVNFGLDVNQFYLVIFSRVSGNDMKYVASTLTLTLDTGD